MQAATEHSVTAIKEISSTIGQIAEISTAIAAAVEEQGAATQEITRNVQEAARGTEEVMTMVRGRLSGVVSIMKARTLRKDSAKLESGWCTR